MPLTAEFNSQYSAKKENDYVLRVHNGGHYYYYDFAARLMVTQAYSGAISINTTPFSQLDRDSLILMRDKLVALGGTPPELPAEAPATSSPAKKLSL